MPVSAIIMLIFGCLVFYGGLAWCIYRAMKNA
ncbi:MAG: MetS family NSS transporter small subunit [Thermoplasmata archaeon]|nr:MAG: MetS family NSS transporter small subunit [Thermoplasmata archaeon]